MAVILALFCWRCRLLLVLALIALQGGCASSARQPVTASGVSSGQASSFANGADGQHIAYRTLGHGKITVILSHCWGCTSALWDDTASRLAQHYRFVLVDLPGHGQSSGTRRAWTVEAYARDLAAVVDSVGGAPVILVGHSMSGRIVTEAACSALRGRVLGVVLVDSVPDVTHIADGRERASLVPRLRSHFDETVHDLVSGLEPATQPQTVARVTALIERMDPIVASEVLAQNLAYPFLERLSSLTVPLWFINASITPTKRDSQSAARTTLACCGRARDWPLAHARRSRAVRRRAGRGFERDRGPQQGTHMKTLIVGIGALGGIIAGRLHAAGASVWLATRNAESAAQLKACGLRITGVGGALSVAARHVAPLDEYSAADAFELIVLATKAQAAIDSAPRLSQLLAMGGTLLPIQNGGVSQILAQQLGNERVLGGLSNLGGTMTLLGSYEQRNSGHLLIGELGGGHSKRAELVRAWLGRAVEVQVTPNLRGAVWSKLILNCSTTTIGAVVGATMREYVAAPEGRELFTRAYDEALSVALASGVLPQRMLVEPMPPGWSGSSIPSAAHDAWLGEVLTAYGDLKASMLQDIERQRPTEIDFINGYVVDLGRQLGVSTAANAAIVATIQAISGGRARPSPTHVARILAAIR